MVDPLAAPFINRSVVHEGLWGFLTFLVALHDVVPLATVPDAVEILHAARFRRADHRAQVPNVTHILNKKSSIVVVVVVVDNWFAMNLLPTIDRSVYLTLSNNLRHFTYANLQHNKMAI